MDTHGKQADAIYTYEWKVIVNGMSGLGEK